MRYSHQKLIIEFASLLLQTAEDLFGAERTRALVGETSIKNIFFGKERKGLFGGRKYEKSFPKQFVAADLQNAILALATEMADVFGFEFAAAKFEIIYGELRKHYNEAVLDSVLLPYIAPRFLTRHRIEHLSKSELEIQVLQKTSELQKLNDELEQKVKNRTAELQKLLEDQHNSAKLLVRRDLELTRVNEQLQELDQRKSEFLSVAAHQLRTPLSGIKWTISMILNGELGTLTSDQKVFLMKSYESNERMINLVDDMLHADRIDSGKYHLNLVRTQVFDLIDNVLYEILPSAQKRNVTIEFQRGTEELPLANIDQEKMRAVFQNLLDNAVKYSKTGGLVTISATHNAENLTFVIEDNGVGVPEDQKQLLFSRFFRARNALKMETDGSGLGLFIVKSIIERHGGKIWFQSEENRGTKFYFTIKL